MKRIKKSWVILAAAFTVLTVLSTMSVKAIGAQSDYSFYKVASAAAGFYDEASAPKSDYAENLDDITGLDMVNGGSFVGYLDKSLSNGKNGALITSGSSQVTETFSYDALEGGPRQYALYGRALALLGLDKTTESSGGGLIKTAGGLLMMVSYLMASTINVLFNFLLSILKYINPFLYLTQWLESGTIPGWLSPLKEYFSALSGFVSSMGVMIPAFLLAFALFSWFLFQRNQEAFTRIKQYVFRILFIAVGIPMLATVYTQTLEYLITWTGNGGVNTNYVLASTYVDFEQWARNTGLALPHGATIAIDTSEEQPGGTIDTGPTSNTWNLALKINKASGNLLTTNINGSQLNDGNSFSIWNNNADPSASQKQEFTIDALNAGVSMLSRYISNAVYTPGQFESEYKSGVSNKEEFLEKMEKASDTANFKESGADSLWTADFIVGNGHKDSLKASSAGNDITFTGEYAYNYLDAERANHTALSTLSMYNYLTSDFSANGVNVYSTSKASNDKAVASHYSVNLVGGSGWMSFFYWFNAFTTMAAMGIVGWGIVLSMILGTAKRAISLIIKTPMALMGSVKGIVDVISTAFMMLVEMLSSIFFFMIASAVLQMLSTVIVNVMDYMVNSGLQASNSVPEISAAAGSLAMAVPDGLMAVGMMLGSAMMLSTSIITLKYRHTLVHSVGDSVSELINRAFVTRSEAAGGSSMMVAAGGGTSTTTTQTQSSVEHVGGDGGSSTIKASGQSAPVNSTPGGRWQSLDKPSASSKAAPSSSLPESLKSSSKPEPNQNGASGRQMQDSNQAAADQSISGSPNTTQNGEQAGSAGQEGRPENGMTLAQKQIADAENRNQVAVAAQAAGTESQGADASKPASALAGSLQEQGREGSAMGQAQTLAQAQSLKSGGISASMQAAAPGQGGRSSAQGKAMTPQQAKAAMQKGAGASVHASAARGAAVMGKAMTSSQAKSAMLAGSGIPGKGGLSAAAGQAMTAQQAKSAQQAHASPYSSAHPSGSSMTHGASMGQGTLASSARMQASQNSAAAQAAQHAPGSLASSIRNQASSGVAQGTLAASAVQKTGASSSLVSSGSARTSSTAISGVSTARIQSVHSVRPVDASAQAAANRNLSAALTEQHRLAQRKQMEKFNAQAAAEKMRPAESAKFEKGRAGSLGDDKRAVENISSLQESERSWFGAETGKMQSIPSHEKKSDSFNVKVPTSEGVKSPDLNKAKRSVK